MASVTVNLSGYVTSINIVRWNDDVSLGTTFSLDGGSQTASQIQLNNANPPGNVYLLLGGTNDRFTAAFEATGRIIFEASDGGTP